MSPVLRDSRGEDEGTKVFFFFSWNYRWIKAEALEREEMGFS